MCPWDHVRIHTLALKYRILFSWSPPSCSTFSCMMGVGSWDGAHVHPPKDQFYVVWDIWSPGFDWHPRWTLRKRRQKEAERLRLVATPLFSWGQSKACNLRCSCWIGLYPIAQNILAFQKMFGFLLKKTHCVGPVVPPISEPSWKLLVKCCLLHHLSQDQIRVSIAIPGMQKDSLQVWRKLGLAELRLL